VGNLPELRLERRAHFRARTAVGAPVALRFRPLSGEGDGADADWIASQARDVGVGGAFVATYRSLPVGTPIEVVVDLPGPEAEVAVRAEVRWLAEPGRLPAGRDAGMGVAFGPLDAESLLAVSEYLAGLAREKAPP
jgi:Tfp pilus assembly protein PilZ